MRNYYYGYDILGINYTQRGVVLTLQRTSSSPILSEILNWYNTHPKTDVAFILCLCLHCLQMPKAKAQFEVLDLVKFIPRFPPKFPLLVGTIGSFFPHKTYSLPFLNSNDCVHSTQLSSLFTELV